MTTEPAFSAAAKAVLPASDTAAAAKTGDAAAIKAAPPKRPAPQPIADDIEASRTFLRDDGWHDQLEGQVRGGVRMLIEALIEAELAEALGRARYKRIDVKRPQPWCQRSVKVSAMKSQPLRQRPSLRPQRAMQRAIATADACAPSWARSARSTSPCRAHASTRTSLARRPSGRPRFCSAISAARRKSMR